MIRVNPAGVAVMLGLMALGCSQEQTTTRPTGPDPAGMRYILTAEPPGAKGVLDVKKSVKDGDEVVIVGRIGGDRNPWVEGRAQFWIVDPSYTPCNEIEGDTCKTPWDYCCAANLEAGLASIKIVDEGGETVKMEAPRLLGVRELDTVVIKGKAKRDDKGNLIVLGSGVYRRPDKKK
jgi:hypothetical protein